MSCSSKTGNLHPVLPLFGAAIIGVALLAGPGAAQAGDAASCDFTPTKPTPAPGPSIFKLPQDQYNHPDVPTEWWFLIGTLKSADKTFGFEVNIPRFGNILAQSWVMISDVDADEHYQQVLTYPMSQLKTSATEFLAEMPNAKMSGPLDNMAVVATLPDGKIELTLNSKGPPLSVWGTGVHDTGKFITNYYSLTDLAAKGTITLKGQSHDVTGVVWMDHEYGGWGASVKWYWQSMILDNGVRIMGFTGATPEIPVDKPLDGTATIQMPDGSEYLEPITMTPHEPIWTSETTGNRYFIKWTMAIPGFNACLNLTSKPAKQEFIIPAFGKLAPQSGIFEGVSTATGAFDGKPVAGTAWSEQVP